MSAGIPTSESLKEKAKLIRKFLNDKYKVDVSHSHCIELTSQIFGFKDWNTAAAKIKLAKPTLPMKIRTVGEMKQALGLFQDEDYIDGMYEFLVKDFLDSLDGNATMADAITQEFSFTLARLDDHPNGPRFASFKLEVENEDIGTPTF